MYSDIFIALQISHLRANLCCEETDINFEQVSEKNAWQSV